MKTYQPDGSGRAGRKGGGFAIDTIVQCAAKDRRARARPFGQQGLMLIDCLIYIALVAVILGLAFAAFFRTLEFTTHLDRNTTEIIRVLEAGERWREDVRSTKREAQVLRSTEEFSLRLPREQGYVAYIVREGAVFREEGGNRVQVMGNVKTAGFYHERRQHVAAWRWELELQGSQKATRLRPLFTFLSLAQGDTAR